MRKAATTASDIAMDRPFARPFNPGPGKTTRPVVTIANPAITETM
jgi:hypothetical protein